jgi:ubiquinone biosynthesis protein
MAVLDLLQKQRPPREALKARQQEIERCLVAYGVTRETGRRTHRASVAGREHMQPPRLRQALESLGPIFSAFGLYMASRVDLLLVHERLELAAITDWAEPTPSATVRELIARETGRSLARGYRIFEDEPCESRLLFQSHRAWLNDGKAVTVKVVHPELQKYLECDLELLPILQPAFAGTMWHGTAFEDAIADFCRILQWQIDLLYGAKVFEMLTRDAQEFEMLKVPSTSSRWK